MQLDQTHVAIRNRTLSEIGDLSLLMIRRYPRAFFRAFFWGAAFWIVADLLVLGWLPLEFSGEELYAEEANFEFVRYLVWMTTLVILQTPIAGVLSTHSLGQAIFEDQPTLRRSIREVRTVFWRWFWVLGIKRLAIPALVIAAWRWGQPGDGFFDIAVPIFLVLIATVIRSSRPFVAEMILLERCPLRSQSSHEITLARRSKALHTPMSSELGGRFLTVSFVLTALLGCVFYSIFWVRGIGIGVWTIDLTATLVFFPLALWLVASLSVIVRLLGYLDARIRLEGWEVELAIRAEAIRQFGDDFMGKIPPPKPRAAGSRISSPLAAAPRAAEPPPPRPAGGSTATTAMVAFALAISLSAPTIAANPTTLVAGERLVGESGETKGSVEPVVKDSVWFDADENRIIPIELQNDRVDSENRQSRWVPRPPKVDKASSPPPPTPAAAPATTGSWFGTLSWGNLFGWVLLGLLLAALVAALAYVFANSSFEFGSDPKQTGLVTSRALDEQTKQRITELPAELRDTIVNPRAELERLIAEGDFDRAIIFLYGHQLLLLDRVGWLRLSRWKTNRQYWAETRRSAADAGDPLRRTIDAFERSYFGRHPIGRDEFDELWAGNLRLEALVSGAQEKAA